MAKKIESMDDVYKILDFKPNDNQKDAINCTEGPLLIIAGPGSGKTHTLVLRCINLLLFKKVLPERIMLCTFTEKAAASLKDKLHQSMIKLDINIDINELYIGTIHSIWADILDEYTKEIGLVKGYTVLDDFSQQLFLNEQYYKIIGKDPQPIANGKWRAINKCAEYFNRITEELLDVAKMQKSKDPLTSRLAGAYEKYVKIMLEQNSVDFAHLQKHIVDLLKKPSIRKKLVNQFDYVMVDEYQDTNYIQEVLFLEFTKRNENLCVVGDDDQALYRFRGATVENIINFEMNFKKVTKVFLQENYRSQPSIVNFYNKFMKETTWKIGGKEFRHPKVILPTRPDNSCASVLKFTKDPYKKVAQLIKKLHQNKTVTDYNQVAILLKSVSGDAPEFIDALKDEGIDSYAPRLGAFMDLIQTKTIIGAFILVMKFEPLSCWNSELAEYYEECVKTTKSTADKNTINVINSLSKDIETLEEKEGLDSLKKGLVDVFYEIVGSGSLKRWVDDEVNARNLAILSDYLTQFQEYYHEQVIRYSSRERLTNKLFNSFLYSLTMNGPNEYEDPYQIFPAGKVQILTIHQAKGLEFPVVIVDSLHKSIRVDKGREELLEPYKHRKTIETHEMKRMFDHSRLFYVSFSRAKDLLILTSEGKVNPRFTEIYDSVPEASATLITPILRLKYTPVELGAITKEFGVTSHIHVYDVCPLQYQYYVDFGFSPSRGAQFMFGSLVHTTIEEIHRHHIENKGKPLPDSDIEAMFYRIYRGLTKSGVHPLAKHFQDMALKQVKSYYKLNEDLMDSICKAEEPIHIPRKDYDMVGVIDLIRGKSGELEILDFKAQTIPSKDSRALKFYQFQLALYAKIIERKLKERPKKAYIYWTSEEVDADKRLEEVDISISKADAAEKHFDEIAQKILKKNFKVEHKVDKDTCRNCDFRHGCKSSSYKC